MLALISAMPEELAAIVAMIDRESVVTIGSREFHVGTCHGHEVVCVVSRIGKVSAATTTAILLERFQPRAVVMTGLAGAVSPALAVGDVVIADRLIQHDLDARPLFPRHEVPLLGVSEMPTDPDLRAGLVRAAEAIEVTPELRDLGITRPRVHVGLIASGDQFFQSVDAVAGLRAVLPDALAVEMEGAAAAQVCHEHAIPCAVARVISDTADHGAAIDFSRFLSVACGPYARTLVTGVLR
ncbi:MAG: 5'-methylthioadenosine/adenosylhomocysteine nucleosidase [Kofleriaceae bacterium]|nr:5'-methylthioadenosine/adenosylhomocysteine nucleosidase [Kofleriaceae bacterium]